MQLKCKPNGDLNYASVSRFVPVCLRHRQGFYGGPITYVESNECPSPIVLDMRGGEREITTRKGRREQ